MIVRELLTVLGFKADDAAANKHELALKRVKVAALAASAAMVAIGTAAIGAATKTANAAREIDRMSRVANASAEEFQRWAAGAETVGIEQEKLSDILKDMNDRVGDFVQTGGGPLLDFFEQIAPKVGVTVKQFQNLSGPEALQLYVSSLERANLSQADMVFYMEAIASDSTALLPLLQDQGAEMLRLGDAAERYGAVLSDDVIKSGNEFKSSMKSIQLIGRGLVYTIGERLLPVLADVASQFLAWYDANGDLIRQNIIGFLDGFVRVLGVAFGAVGDVLGLVNDLVQSMGGWEPVLRVVAYALGILAANRLIAGLVALVRAIRAFGIAMAAAQAVAMWPIALGAAIVAGLALILDDIVNWVQGNDNLIGRFLGTWEDMKTKLSGIIDSVLDKIQALKDAWRGFWESVGVDFDGGSVDRRRRRSRRVSPGVAELAAPGGLGLSPDAALAGNTTNNTSTTITNNMSVQLPAGAPATQRDFVEQEVVPVIEEAITRSARRAARNYPRAEQ